MWTNTCCSHPLGIPGEGGADLETAIMGVKRAAQRKLTHELGIPASQVPLEDFHFLTRIHYKAPSDGKWGEHESETPRLIGPRPSANCVMIVDYILFIQANVTLDINPNEIMDAKYVTADELKTMFREEGLIFTPWFKLICETMLFEWWSSYDNLEKYKNEQGIRRM